MSNEIQENEVEIDEALKRLGFGKFNYIIVILSGAIGATSTYDFVGISLVYPLVECDIEMTTSDEELLNTASSLGIIISFFLCGFLSDKYGRKMIIVPALFASFIFIAATSIANNFWILMILRFFSGFAVSGSKSIIMVYLAEFHSTKNLSKVMMTASVIFGIACNYFSILGLLVINTNFHLNIPWINVLLKPWRLYILALGIPSFICGITLSFRPESPKYILTKFDEGKVLEILRKIYRMNNQSKVENYNVTRILEDKDEPEYIPKNLLTFVFHQIQQLISRKYRWKMMIVGLILFFILMFVQGPFIFFPELISEFSQHSKKNMSDQQTICRVHEMKKLASAREFILIDYFHNVSALKFKSDENCQEILETSTFLFFIKYQIFFTILAIFVAIIINKSRKLGILVVIFLGSGLSIIATTFTKIPWVSINLCVIFLQANLTVQIIMTIVCNMFPTHLRATSLCLCWMFARIGGIIGTSLIDFLLNRNCDMASLVSGFTMFFCALLSCFIPNIREVHKKGPKNGAKAENLSRNNANNIHVK